MHVKNYAGACAGGIVWAVCTCRNTAARIRYGCVPNWGRNLLFDDVMPIVRGQIAAGGGAAAQKPGLYIHRQQSAGLCRVQHVVLRPRAEGLDGIVSSMKYDMYLCALPI